MARRLTDVKVDLISILTDDTKPSNRQKVMIKSDDSFSLECEVRKEETDAIKGILYTTAMKALYEDTDKEYYENEDVEKTAHEFMKAGIEGKADTNHTFKVEKGVHIVESYVDKKEEGYEWKVAFDISENEELMQKAKDGKINGVSIAGKAKAAEDNPKITKEVIQKMDVELEIDTMELEKALEMSEKIVKNMKEAVELRKQLITQESEQQEEPIQESVEKNKKEELILIKKTEVKSNE